MTPAGSYLDEGSCVGLEHLDPASVASYDAKTGADLDADLALLRLHGLGPEATLVDLGAGTGALAAVAARRCRRVVAVDPSPAMVAVARTAAEPLLEHVGFEIREISHRRGAYSTDVCTAR